MPPVEDILDACQLREEPYPTPIRERHQPLDVLGISSPEMLGIVFMGTRNAIYYYCTFF